MPKILAQFVHRPCAFEVLFETCVAMKFADDDDDNRAHILQGSHYILLLKFKDFSRTFKDPKVAFSRTNSRRKFTA